MIIKIISGKCREVMAKKEMAISREMKMNHFKIDDLYGIAESVLALLMKLGEPFAFDSDLICSINLFDECFCPNCIDQGDQDGC